MTAKLGEEVPEMKLARGLKLVGKVYNGSE
jgi:hypothetical protein